MRYEWASKYGGRWYAKDGTVWGAELGYIDEDGSEHEAQEDNAPLPEPAAEILRLVARVRELEALAQVAGAATKRAAEIEDEHLARIAALEEENRRLRIAIGEERFDWIDSFKGSDEDRVAAINRHAEAVKKLKPPGSAA